MNTAAVQCASAAAEAGCRAAASSACSEAWRAVTSRLPDLMRAASSAPVYLVRRGEEEESVIWMKEISNRQSQRGKCLRSIVEL